MPRGVKVDVRGVGIFGGFGGTGGSDSVLGSAEYPTLVVKGVALFGGVGVRVDYDCPPLTVVKR